MTLEDLEIINSRIIKLYKAYNIRISLWDATDITIVINYKFKNSFRHSYYEIGIDNYEIDYYFSDGTKPLIFDDEEINIL